MDSFKNLDDLAVYIKMGLMHKAMFTRIVAVVGFKGAGKTRLIEKLVGRLSSRGYRVGTLKHSTPHHPLDTPGKDTWRHREAGAEASAIIADGRAAIFIDRPLTPSEALEILGPLDFVILEGFKSIEYIPRILVVRRPSEVMELSNGLEIAIVSDQSLEGLGIEVPTLSFDEVEELASIVEERAIPLLPGLNCGGCGYESCRELALAALRGEADPSRCVHLSVGDVVLRVDGRRIPLNPYVRRVFRDVLKALVGTLRGCEEAKRIEVSVEAEGDV